MIIVIIAISWRRNKSFLLRARGTDELVGRWRWNSVRSRQVQIELCDLLDGTGESIAPGVKRES